MVHSRILVESCLVLFEICELVDEAELCVEVWLLEALLELGHRKLLLEMKHVIFNDTEFMMLGS
jgi:hypothetical protein